MVAGR